MPKTIEMPLEEFDEIRAARTKAEQRVVELETQLAEGVFKNDLTSTLRGACRVARAALDITRFAVANLPPEVHRKWPHATLKEIVAFLPMMPDKTPDDRELAGELLAFAEECERWETRRATRKSPAIDSAPSAPVDDTAP